MLSSLTLANGEVLIAILRHYPNRFEQICLMFWKEKIQMVIKAQRSSSYIIKSILLSGLLTCPFTSFPICARNSSPLPYFFNYHYREITNGIILLLILSKKISIHTYPRHFYDIATFLQKIDSSSYFSKANRYYFKEHSYSAL